MGFLRIYIATESRFSYDSTNKFDFGKKVFASSTYPDIFGYVGDCIISNNSAITNYRDD